MGRSKAEMAVSEVGDFDDFINPPATNMITKQDGSIWVAANATFADISSLPETVRTEITAPMPLNGTFVTNNQTFLPFNTFVTDFGVSPDAKVGSVECVSVCTNGTTGYIARFASTDIKVIPTGIVTHTGTTNPLNSVVTSDGTAFWQWHCPSATTFGAATSTDGETWTIASLTGLPTFSSLTSYSFYANGNQSEAPLGVRNYSPNSPNSANIALHCGARHLLIGPGASGLIAAISTNGLAWSDVTAAMLGSPALPNGTAAYNFVHKNGNKVFLALGTTGRYSADGGVTWAAVTNMPAMSAAQYYQVSATDPNMLVASSAGTNIISVSTDSGASWTNRTLSFLASTVSPAFVSVKSGVIVVGANGLIRQSSNNGATWTPVNLPTASNPNTFVYCDATRWYAVTPYQVATSLALTGWMLRTLLNTNTLSIGVAFSSVIAFDADVVVLSGASTKLVTTDGGVTWRYSNFLSSTEVSQACTRAKLDTSHVPMMLSCSTTGGLTAVTRDEIVAGPKFVRTSTSIVASLRANAISFVRVK
jgi:photosystem II stability/assembly factor-like uncharacterized protein